MNGRGGPGTCATPSAKRSPPQPPPSPQANTPLHPNVSMYSDQRFWPRRTPGGVKIIGPVEGKTRRADPRPTVDQKGRPVPVLPHGPARTTHEQRQRTGATPSENPAEDQRLLAQHRRPGSLLPRPLLPHHRRQPHRATLDALRQVFTGNPGRRRTHVTPQVNRGPEWLRRRATTSRNAPVPVRRLASL